MKYILSPHILILLYFYTCNCDTQSDHMTSTCIIIHKTKIIYNLDIKCFWYKIAHKNIIWETLWNSVTCTMHSKRNNCYQLICNFVQVQTDLQCSTLLPCDIFLLSWHLVISWYTYSHHIYQFYDIYKCVIFLHEVWTMPENRSLLRQKYNTAHCVYELVWV